MNFNFMDSYTINLTPSNPTRDLALPYHDATIVYDSKVRKCFLYYDRKDVPPLTETQGVLVLTVTKKNTIKITSPLNQNILANMAEYLFYRIREGEDNNWSGEFIRDPVVITKFNKN